MFDKRFYIFRRLTDYKTLNENIIRVNTIIFTIGILIGFTFN